MRRAEILSLPVPGATVFDQLGKIVIAGEKDVGKRLVITQQDVEAGLQLLDQVRFKQQRLAFRPRGHDFHRSRL